MAAVMVIGNVAKNAHFWHHNRQKLKRSCAMSIMKNYTGMPKKATNVSLAETLLAEAKALQINVSQAAEAGVVKAVSEKRAELWIKENAKAFECWNRFVEKNGLPLEQYRSF